MASQYYDLLVRAMARQEQLSELETKLWTLLGAIP